MTPYASFIIPTYNRADLLQAAVASLLAQTRGDLEVIVVDDGSTDDTAAVIQPFLADRRLRYLTQTNQGRSAARNHGAQLAHGQFLGFLDSDDLQLTAALEAHQRWLVQDPRLALMIGGYEYIDENGGAIGRRLPWTESSDLGLGQWIFNCFGVHGAFLLRRDWFEQVHGYDTDPNIDLSEDWDLFLRLAQAGCPMGWTREIVCQYRQHPGNSIHSLARHRDSSLRALEKVFRRPDLPSEIARLAPQAKAWVYVVFARRAFAAGLTQWAVQYLQQALDLDPALAGDRRPQLLETLFTPDMLGQQADADMPAAVASHLPAALQRHQSDIRQAQARVHMARFFHADSDGTRQRAAAHLRAGVRLDPRWLINRGVRAYCFRRALGRTRPAAAKAHG